MRKAKIMFVIILGMVLIPGVIAEQSQGLYWGVAVNQMIPYSVTTSGNIPTSTTLESPFEIQLIVSELSFIPPTVSTVYDIPPVKGILTTNNGTHDLTLTVDDLFIPTFIVPILLMHPIGNWEHIQRLYTSALLLLNVTWHDDVIDWGYSTSWNQTIYNISIEIKYSKTDGALSYMESSMTHNATDSFEVTIERQTSIDMTPIFVTAGGAIVFVILVIVIIRRRS